MTVLYESIHGPEFLIRGQTPAIPDNVTVTVSGGDPWRPGQVLGRVTASGKYVKYAPAAIDGSQSAVGVLWHELRPVAGDVRAGALLRAAEVSSTKLFGMDRAAVASLATKGILVREGQTMEGTYCSPGFVEPGYFE